MKKLVLLLSLCCVLCVQSYSSDLVFKPQDWSQVWQSVDNIEKNLNQLKIENQRLETLYQEQVQYSTAQEMKLQTYEQNLKLWKRITIISITCTVSTIILWKVTK